jgi:cbb3-type cytochrome oxidase maturation protein
VDGRDRDVSEFFARRAQCASREARGTRHEAREKFNRRFFSSSLTPRASRLNFRMEILYLLIPLSVVLVFLIGGIFWWSVKSGQFDDLEGPAHRILDDDDTPEGR